ncbi:hypothetical protein SDIMI_v3c07840 [Spiroplasma diminutum CUAS-1]|uniref:Acyltransferase 3 domain-containing protein n=2 Tax=Spiroplasma diminutum TaxID=216936 RepID=S5MFB3_9MOLU|nr:hypothetical protein SDIMI_v3c07840 [Spiroplasma diminutum CUAS-1]
MCITVVMYHTRVGGGESSWIFVSFAPIIGSGVLVFALISGYFMINKSYPSILKLFLTIVFYLTVIIFINLIIESLFFGKIEGFNKTEWLYNYGTINMWYIWTLLFVYILSIPVNYFLKRTNIWYSLFVIVACYATFYGVIRHLEYFKNFSINNIFYLNIIYMTGAWLKLHSHKLMYKNNDLLYIASLVWIPLAMIINIFLFIIIPGKTSYLFGNNNPSSIFTAVSIFHIFSKFKIKENKIINILGKLSIPIYFINYSFIKIFLLFVSNVTANNDLAFILLTSLVFSISFLFALILFWPMEKIINYLNNFIISVIIKCKKFIYIKK